MRAFVGWGLLLQGGCGELRNIADVLDCDPSGVEAVPDGGSLHRVTVSDGVAHCNDGSPPVMAVRPATDPAHADDWVIYLEGGFQCSSGADCRQRWCGTGDGSANLMSSEFWPESMSRGGLFVEGGRSPTDGWNQAVLHYCTSDFWLGTAPEEVELDAFLTRYSVWFQGHQVVLSLLDRLDEGAVSDDGAVEMPALRDAARLVFAGSSAGGIGATHHLDLVADRYPDTEVYGLFDGSGTLDVELSSEKQQDHFAKIDDRRFQSMYVDKWQAFTEGDCSGSGCMDEYALMRDAVSTPYLYRHDLKTSLYFAHTDPAGLPRAEASALMAESVLALAEARPDVSVHESGCNVHVLATSTEFYQVKVDGSSTADVLAAALAGEPPLVLVDGGTGAQSTCP